VNVIYYGTINFLIVDLLVYYLSVTFDIVFTERYLALK